MGRGWEPRQNRGGERKMREKSPPIVFHHDMYELLLLLSLHICWKENDDMPCYVIAESPVISPSLNLETHKDTCQQFGLACSLVHSGFHSFR